MSDNENIDAIECRFATYVKSKDDYENDLHVAKIQVHRMGEVVPKLKLIPNWKIPFYVSKKASRTHKDKKEWEDIKNLDKFITTRRNLINNAVKALGKFGFRGSLRDLQESPYLYGTDISSTALLKHEYNSRSNKLTLYSNAVFDTETDMVNGTGEIIMATVSFKDKLICAIRKEFVNGHSEPERKIRSIAKDLLGDIIEKRKINIEIALVNSEIDIIKTTIAKAHQWMPDFLSVWNLAFDMNKIIEACNRAGADIDTIMSDPIIPPQYRNFRWKEGPAKKVTASGVVMSYKPSDRWHSVSAPASFFWIDAMCTYRKVRIGSPEEKSYSLDAILKKELDIGKLKFDEAKEYEDNGAKWHWYMQTNYPLHYVVYNMFDCISMEMLDEKTNDLSVSLPMFSGSSDFNNFNSQPKRLADALHYFCLENDKVIGSTSNEMATEMDSTTVPLSDWIKQSHILCVQLT